MSDFVINGTMNLEADLEGFKTQMSEIRDTYVEAKEDIEKNGIKAPLNSDEAEYETRRLYSDAF